MIEGPEVEAHHSHKTGHSHIDLILGCLAVVLSMVSVFIAVRHGETMERLVAANSWPNISYTTGNEAHGVSSIVFNIRNTGVGPARIDSFELFYKGVPMRNAEALLHACCDVGAKPNFDTEIVRDNVLPARDDMDFLELTASNNDQKLWQVLNRERFNVRVRACYCSVFEECWVRDSSARRPERVAQCTPSQPQEFGL